MTSLNDIAEDPTGFRIEPRSQGDGQTWAWVRISDNVSQKGFATRADAIDDALSVSRESATAPKIDE